MAPLKRTMVIIDDDDGVRLSLHTFFDVCGYEVASFDCAEDYLSSDLAVPDCLLVDLELHGLNGIMTLEILQDTNRFGPTIIITGTYRDDLLQAAEKSAAHKIAYKPLQPDQLADEVEALIHMSAVA